MRERGHTQPVAGEGTGLSRPLLGRHGRPMLSAVCGEPSLPRDPVFSGGKGRDEPGGRETRSGPRHVSTRLPPEVPPWVLRRARARAGRTGHARDRASWFLQASDASRSPRRRDGREVLVKKGGLWFSSKSRRWKSSFQSAVAA